MQGAHNAKVAGSNPAIATMNSKQKGTVGVAKAIAHYAERGYVVSVPLTDSQAYDLLIEKDGVILRVQVKTTEQMSEYGVPRVELRTKGGNKSGTGREKRIDCESVDLIFVSWAGRSYEIPSADLHGRNCINLGNAAQKYLVAVSKLGEGDRL